MTSPWEGQEKALIGALLANNAALHKCYPLMELNFLNPTLGAIYAAIRDGVGKGQYVDAVTLQESFDRRLLVECLSLMVGMSSVGTVARAIYERYWAFWDGPDEQTLWEVPTDVIPRGPYWRDANGEGTP